MTQDMAVVDGELLPLTQARVSVLDLGFIRGCGAFETLSTFAGHPHAVGDHLRRLAEACAGIAIDLPFDEGRFRAHVRDLVATSGYADLRLNIIVTPGDLTDGVFGSAGSRYVIIAKELVRPAAMCYRNGVTAVTFRGQRMLPAIKATTYITGKRGLAKAAAVGAHEAFYMDETGHLTEGVTSNLHLLHGNTVTSPVADCLPGITRSGVKALAQAAGLDWVDGAVDLTAVRTADECWITSAVRQLLPVVRVDAIVVGTGRPGPWAERLHAAYHARAQADAAADAAAWGAG